MRCLPSGSPAVRPKVDRVGAATKWLPLGISSETPLGRAGYRSPSGGRRRHPDGALDLAVLEAAFAVPPKARGSGPGRTGARRGNPSGGGLWRDDRPRIRFEDTSRCSHRGTNRRSFGSRARGLLRMKGVGRVNVDARRTNVSPTAGPRTRGTGCTGPSPLGSCRSLTRVIALRRRRREAPGGPTPFAFVHERERTLLPRCLWTREQGHGRRAPVEVTSPAPGRAAKTVKTGGLEPRGQDGSTQPIRC